MNIITNNKWIGQRTIRPDGADKVTGRAAFAADTNMPGMIWGKVLRSPHPHARIRGIDTSKAERLAGVKAVVTARDIVDFPIDKSVMLGIQDMRWMCRNVMAREKALFPGHPVAAVAATTEEIAAKACELIEVDYEPLATTNASGDLVASALDGSNYSEYIVEKVEPWSYLKSTYYKPLGFPEGVYRVGPLARLNVADRCGTPRADQELAEFHELQRTAPLPIRHRIFRSRDIPG